MSRLPSLLRLTSVLHVVLRAHAPGHWSLVIGHWSFHRGTLTLRLWLLVAIAAMSAAHAQSVRWEPASGTLALNQLSELSLVFEQCEPVGAVSPPSVSGLVFGSPSRSENTAFNVVNFKATTFRTVTFTYRVRPTERRKLTIPAFTVETDKGRQRVEAAGFEVGDATVGQTGLPIDDVARSAFTLPSPTVWAGEVFPLTYTLSASKTYLYNLNKDFEWNTAPLAIEPWGTPEQHEAVLNNQPRVSIIYKTRALAKTPGDYALHPATHLVNVTTGAAGFGVFGRTQLQQLAIASPRVDLSVKPLPSPAPAGFNGAVGQFTLDSKVVPATAAVGEPITWTLTLDGTGNWPDIPGLPARSVSKDLTPVTPQAKRVNKEGALFDASITEDIVLIPKKPGRYTLGPVAYAIFNPQTGAYETLTTQPVTIQVSAGAPASASSTSASDNPSDPALPHSDIRPSAAVPPAAIPRDPLPPAGESFAPLSRPSLVVALACSALLPLVVWLGLAFRRARVTDPARAQREARSRLSTTLRQIETAPASRLPLLQQWQRDTAILWNLSRAVPTPGHFADERWSALWSETDRALYGDAPLPSDWTSRAQAALAAHRTPAFSAFQLFLPRNLLPIVLLLSSFVINHSSFAADGGAAAYAAGDFSSASGTWSDTLKASPTDWTAHHNLALALIQQNRPGEAAGHALAAFVQQPQNPSVRWHLGYAFKAAGVTPPALKPFLEASPLAQLARLASPTRWQFVLIASAWLGAGSLALTVWSAYHKRTSAASPAHSSFVIRHSSFRRALAAVAALLALAAGLSLHTYGPLADARAVVVVNSTTLRSIPTDLDTQKTTSLQAGTLANTDKTFLGWRRLVFPDGQTGWVRAETVVPLWTATR